MIVYLVFEIKRNIHLTWKSYTSICTLTSSARSHSFVSIIVHKSFSGTMIFSSHRDIPHLSFFHCCLCVRLYLQLINVRKYQLRSFELYMQAFIYEKLQVELDGTDVLKEKQHFYRQVNRVQHIRRLQRRQYTT